MELGPRVIFSIGPVQVTETVCFAWILSILILIFVFVATRNLQKIPKGSQNVAELLVEFIYKMVKDVMGDVSEKFTPYIGTLIVFLGAGGHGAKAGDFLFDLLPHFFAALKLFRLL